MVATGDIERVELERADPVDDGHDARRLRRQRPGRGEEVAKDEEAAGDVAGDASRPAADHGLGVCHAPAC